MKHAAVLEGIDVSKRFGGLAALSGVSFRVAPGEIVGASNGRDITGLPAYRIARLGIGRTFQAPRLFPYLTAFQSVLLGSFFRPRAEASLRTREAAVAEAMFTRTPGCSMPHGIFM